MELFNLNDKIEIRSKDDERTAGFIYDKVDGDLLVAISADDESFKLLRDGETVTGVVYCKDELVAFKTEIVGRKAEELSLYRLGNIRGFKRIQRRENIRVNFTEELYYTREENVKNLNVNEENIERSLNKLEVDLNEGVIIDLSAGGLKFATKKKFDPGTRLLFTFNLEGQIMVLKGRIVHRDINLAGKKTIYKYGVEFYDITEKQQEKIIKSLFVIMRKNISE